MRCDCCGRDLNEMGQDNMSCGYGVLCEDCAREAVEPSDIECGDETFGNVVGKCPICGETVYGDAYEYIDYKCPRCGNPLKWDKWL